MMQALLEEVSKPFREELSKTLAAIAREQRPLTEFGFVEGPFFDLSEFEFALDLPQFELIDFVGREAFQEAIGAPVRALIREMATRITDAMAEAPANGQANWTSEN